MDRCILLLFVLLCAGHSKAQQPGDLDSSFAVNGKFAIDGDLSVKEIISLTDGKILVMATNVNSTTIYRLEENGSLDPTFGQTGSIVVNSVGVRLFYRYDSRIILVSNEYPSGYGSVQCFLENGQSDLSYGIGGIVSDTSTTLETQEFHEADMSPEGKLLVCGKLAFVLAIDPNGQIIHNETYQLPDTPFVCPSGTSYQGQTLHVLYRSQTIRFAPDGEVWFYYRKQIQQCSNNYPNVSIHRRLFDWTMNDLGSTEMIPAFIGNVPTLSSMCVPVNAPYCYVVRSSISSISRLDGPPSSTCINDEDLDLYFSGYTDSVGVYHPSYSPSVSSRSYGSISVDQAGSYIVPLLMGGSFWTYKTEPYCFSPDSSWGYDGHRPPENSYPVLGKAEASAVQTDGKILVGGRTTQDGMVVYRYHNIPDPRSKVYLKVFLDGSYDPASGLMNDHLNQQELIPFNQPYAPPAFQPKNGVGTWGLGPGVLDIQGDSAIVDWIWLELLDPDSLSIVKATRVGLLHRNGEVTASDGISPIDFSVGAGSYHLRVRHRNHLSVTTADPIALSADPIEIDLTSPNTPTFGFEAQKEVNGVMVMWPGDVTSNGIVKYMGPANDRDPILIGIGGTDPTSISTGYSPLDVNMDGIIKYIGSGNDRDIILQTIGGAIPTEVRSEQTPE